MSQPRFAPITASLLARKGSAIPSTMGGHGEAHMRPAAYYNPGNTAPKEPVPMRAPETTAEHDLHAAEAHDPARIKKLFVPLSHKEYERLAIAAVKTGLSRHQLVRDALEHYFEQLIADMGEDCRCISGASCANGCVWS